MKKPNKIVAALARIGRTSAVVFAARFLFLKNMSQKNAELLINSAIEAAHDANIILENEND